MASTDCSTSRDPASHGWENSLHNPESPKIISLYGSWLYFWSIMIIGTSLLALVVFLQPTGPTPPNVGEAAKHPTVEQQMHPKLEPNQCRKSLEAGYEFSRALTPAIDDIGMEQIKDGVPTR
jgi:hypothetical protein